MPVTTPAKANGQYIDRDECGRFLTGNKGGGRPKGARNKLGEQFIEAVYTDWCEHGPAALARVREANPAAYVRMIATLVPHQVELTANN